MSETSELKPGSWAEELIIQGWKLQIQVEKVLMPPQHSKFQEIAVFESAKLGRVLIIDGRIQLTTADEFTYHEMMTHLPIMAHGKVKNILVIGGGDGGALRECMKHKGVKATLVDIDEKIIECSKNFFPTLHAGVWENPNVTTIVGDGIKFVEETPERFDVIIIDSTDPVEEGPSSVLYKPAFYQSCKRCLNPGGILVAQNGHPQFESYSRVALSHMAQVFKHTTVYQFSVPTYLGGLESIGFASDNPDTISISVEELEKRWKATGIDNAKHYTPAYHKAVFVLPKWLQQQVDEAHELAKKNSN